MSFYRNLIIATIATVAIEAVLVTNYAHANEYIGSISNNNEAEITSTFGTKMYNGEHERVHQGIDIRFNKESNVLAPFAGHISILETYELDGKTYNYVLLTAEQPNTDAIVFGNVVAKEFKNGDFVKEGTIIGTTNETENLHVEYWPNGFKHDNPIDPRPLIVLGGVNLK